MMAVDEIEEALNISLSAEQRAAIDRHMRWHIALLDAGISEDEAEAILADGETEQLRRAA